jgi:MFS family permease
MNATTNATTVASVAAVTELFPTTLRGTMMGWVALTTAFGAVSAEATIATLCSYAEQHTRRLARVAVGRLPAGRRYFVRSWIHLAIVRAGES